MKNWMSVESLLCTSLSANSPSAASMARLLCRALSMVQISLLLGVPYTSHSRRVRRTGAPSGFMPTVFWMATVLACCTTEWREVCQGMSGAEAQDARYAVTLASRPSASKEEGMYCSYTCLATASWSPWACLIFLSVLAAVYSTPSNRSLYADLDASLSATVSSYSNCIGDSSYVFADGQVLRGAAQQLLLLFLSPPPLVQVGSAEAHIVQQQVVAEADGNNNVTVTSTTRQMKMKSSGGWLSVHCPPVSVLSEGDQRHSSAEEMRESSARHVSRDRRPSHTPESG
eukprot:CAMPEP_0173279418 /NCGR_PEP_ID=MMETSP1143-20121109/5152_1 /TAXON_ID=483371 /ORGANISM="non described non described, Strain CCMP2298" /LENGTH=285 /DNA_ID=CAMNT_0014216673 /DNA_START=1852 /DNA_END=2709 /DNA_ORIENTATION=-